MSMQALVDRNGVEIVVFTDRTSAWHKFGTDSTIIRTALIGDVPVSPKESRRNTRLIQLLGDNVVLAEGCVFSDGVCVIRWKRGTAVYGSTDDALIDSLDSTMVCISCDPVICEHWVS